MKLSFLLFFFLFSFSSLYSQKLALVPYVSGINSPVDIKNCGDERLFVAGQDGKIRIINADGTLRPTPFLNISSKISNGPEDGLLGIAFSTDYKTSRKFYVYYIANISGIITSVLEEYKVSEADSNLADISSALTILTLSQPFDTNVGGNLMFGPDGYLYLNIGDGAKSGDPAGNGQNKTTLHGKMLRIDVSNSSSVTPYNVPASNPFYNDPDPAVRKELWAYGLRNPWRSSFDKLTGDYWITDVGDNRHEEINYLAANSAGGQNYGWHIMEGIACYNPATGCNISGLTLPIYDYSHQYGFCLIGGYVYRSAQSKALFGTYIFGDWAKKWIDGIRQSNGVVSGAAIHLITADNAIGSPAAFGEDIYGDQYVMLTGSDTIFRLEDTSYNRKPKAWYNAIDENSGSTYLLKGLQGRNITYQWLKNNAAITGANLPDYDVNSNGYYSLVVTNELGFKDTSDIFPFGALPLNIISFAGEEINPGKIGLQWKTSSEQNMKGYNIQRKQAHELDFSSIGFVASKSVNGNSSSQLSYSFIDSSIINNTKIFYRLQVQNKDGRYTYSDIISIIHSKNKNIFSLYPNPVKGQFTVYINKFTQPVMMNIYDNSGQKIKKQLLSQQNTTIKIAGAKGIYIVQLSNTDGSNLQREKLLVE